MAESVANHHKPFRAGLHSLVVTLRAADESLVSNCGELLAILDNPIRHVRVKLHSEGDKSFFVGWWKIAKPTDQAHQQRPIFNCDHVSRTGKVRCRSGNKYERFSGERFGSAEVRRAVSCVQVDFSFLRRGKTDGCKSLPSPVCSAGRINYQIRLDRT